MSQDHLYGEIYMVTCRPTAKSYVGQAKKVMGQTGQKHGALRRWQSQVNEARPEKEETVRGPQTLLKQAIREHGADAFDLKVLEECLLENIDDREVFYITEYNTLEPNGYNMTIGGKGITIHSDLTNKKKLKKKDADEAGPSTLTDMLSRLEVMKELPKYIYEHREGSDKPVIGYRIVFNNGVEAPSVVKKKFLNSSDPSEALGRAKAYLENLIVDYEKRKAEFLRRQQNNTELAEFLLKNPKLPKLDDNLYYLVDNNVLKGYFVDGLYDYKGTNIPKRVFNEYQQNTHNLDNAKKFMELVAEYNQKLKIPTSWLTVPLPKREKPQDLPNHIRPYFYQGQHVGYRVDYFLRYEGTKQVVESKTFTKKKLSMEQKLKLAIDYVAELDQKHNKKESS